MERKYIIYSHTTPSGKVYIGQTCQKDPNRRWRNGEGYKHCKLFYSSIKKYGWNSIAHKILHTDLTKEKADILEKMYIQFFKRKNISLNIADGGEGGPRGHFSAEHRRKISKAHKGKVLTEEHRRKMSEAKKGKPLSVEHRQKISESHKGKPRGPHTAEAKRKISETNKGKHLTAETKRKLSEINKGKVLTIEQCRKISEFRKGRPQKRSIWLNSFNQEIEMSDCHAKRYHPTWIKVRDL